MLDQKKRINKKVKREEMKWQKGKIIRLNELHFKLNSCICLRNYALSQNVGKPYGPHLNGIKTTWHIAWPIGFCAFACAPCAAQIHAVRNVIINSQVASECISIVDFVR